MSISRTLFAAGLLALAVTAQAAEAPKPANPRVTLETSKGKIVLELDAQKAPKTVANFLFYVESKFYDGTVFHRVIPRFMVQGGGFTADLQQKNPTKGSIQNEADNGLTNDRGTVAMARTSDPHSASAQFFINSVDNAFLNHKGKTPDGWGYAVFGKVVEGLDVIDAISKIPTTGKGPFRSDVPTETVTLIKATVQK